MVRRRPFAFSLLLLVGACGPGSSDGPGSAAVRDTVEGIPRLTVAMDDVTGLGWRLDTLTVVGDPSGNEPRYQFDGVTADGLAGTRDGDLLVLDAAGGRVLRYDATGSFVRAYGREGQGPGEITRPQALDVARDTVWVLESNGRRITGYPLDGGEGRTDARVVSLPGNLIPVAPLRVVPDGEAWGAASGEDGAAFLVQKLVVPAGPGAPPGPSRSDEGGSPERIPILALGPDGAVLGEVWRGPLPAADPVTFTTSGRRYTALIPRQLAALLRWTTLSDGTVVVSDSAAYRLTLVAPSGSPRLRIRRDGPPRPTSEADRDSVRARIRREAEADGTAPAFVDQRVAGLTFEDVVPWITGVRADHRDRIWVGVSLARPGLTDRVDVYEPTGRSLGSLDGVELPAIFLPDGRAASLAEDPETGAQSVVLTRLEEGGQ